MNLTKRITKNPIAGIARRKNNIGDRKFTAAPIKSMMKYGIQFIGGSLAR